MKKKLLLSIFLWLLILPAFSQIGAYNNWIFGTYAGISFNSGSPVPSAGPPIKLKSLEACGTISDISGNMLMYSDGVNLWDGTNTLRSSALLGAESGAQGILIIPFPGSTTKFYLFTGSVDPTSGGIGQPNKGVNYLVVDISTAVWTYTAVTNLVSTATATEHLTAVSDGLGGFWIVSHLNTNGVAPGSKSIISFHFNAAGTNDAGPIVSSAGGTNIVNYIGSAKSNSCGNKIAFTYLDAGVVELYTFDNSVGGGTSGKVTGLLNSIATPTAYGLEFSPDDKLLYFTSLSGNAMYQLNISAGTVFTNATWVSKNDTIGGGVHEMAQLQLGPDGLIYVAESSNGGQATIYVGAIQSPNTVGLGANYNGKQVTISTTNGSDGYPFRGLPDFYRTLVVSSSIKQYPVTGGYCISTGIPLSYVYAGSVASQTWTVSPGVLGTDYTYTSGNGTSVNPTINFSTAGTYKVKLAITDNCAHVYLDSMTYTITTPKIPAGLISCGAGTLTLTATGTLPADYPNYTWYDAASGGNILGVGSPVTLNYSNITYTPTSVWVQVAGSVTTTSSGTNQTIGLPSTSLTWPGRPAGNYGPTNFTVLATSLTLKSFVVTPQNLTSGNFTVIITNTSTSTVVFQQNYTTGATGAPYTVNINSDFPAGTYSIKLTSASIVWGGGTWNTPVTNPLQITLPGDGGTSGTYGLANFIYNYKNISTTTTCSNRIQVTRHCITVLPGNGTYCTGNTIPLSYTFEGTPISQSWAISPGTLGTDWVYTTGNSASAAPVIKFLTTGTYTVTVIVTDASGNYSKFETFTIIASSVPSATLSCSLPTITLNANGVVAADYPNYTYYDASTGGNIIGVGNPASVNYGGISPYAPTSFWLETAASASISSSGTSQTIGPASASLTWPGRAAGNYGPVPFTVLSNILTLKSFVITPQFSTSGAFTVSIKNSSSAIVFQQNYTTGASTVPYTVNINTDFPTGNYTINITSASIVWGGTSWAGSSNAQINLPAFGGAGTYGLANLIYDYKNFSVTPSCPGRVQIMNSCSLPISMLSFTGTDIGSKNLLNWITSSEKNNAYFEIQKSTDNMNFETIGKVNGNGTTNSIQYYNFTDNNVTGIVNYYRIIQYDFDGKTSISPIVSIETNGGATITIAPNPSHDAFNLTLSKITSADLTVLDVLGREIYSIHIVQGRNLVTFGADLQNGAYILQVKTSDQVFIQRIFKE